MGQGQTETEYGENSTLGGDRDSVWEKQYMGQGQSMGKQYIGWGHTEYGENSTGGGDRQKQSMGKTVHGAGTEYGENSTWGGDRQSMGKTVHGTGTDRHIFWKTINQWHKDLTLSVLRRWKFAYLCQVT